MVLGAIVVLDTLERLRDFHSFYVTNGLSLFGSNPFDSVLWGSGSATRVGLVFAVTAVSALCFAAGLFTKGATAATWLLHIALVQRNRVVSDGSDVLMSCLLFWCLFADVGATASLDVLLR